MKTRSILGRAMVCSFCAMAWAASGGSLAARDIHVAVTGEDAADGSAAKPLRTIQAAAKLAMPGDVVTVREGIYRERIDPPRGGESEAKCIVYQAAPGAKVAIKGSEVVKGWAKVENDTWKVVLPNRFFGGFNPYADEIRGDWFKPRGRKHHTGAVYLNGHWLVEAAKLEEAMKPAGKQPLWFATVDENNTTIVSQFPGTDPNRDGIEINVRQAVFYPSQTGRNFITVRGFTLEHAATNWAPPTAEQIGLIGTHWSKGWVIENNTIRYSACSGVTLGKHGDEFDNTSANSAAGYVETIKRGHAAGWSKDNIGHHVVRNNHISHCEQTGICGSLGPAFSTISGNEIHDIHVRQLFSGAEMAGIKFHGAIDTVISGNHIYRAYRGLWLDWMAQGTRVSGNLFHNNSSEDIYVEVNHGPFLVDNNLLLSSRSLWDMSEGGAYVHNLLTGKIDNWYDMGRPTPHMRPHSTTIAELAITQGGDNRFFNNIFVGQGGAGKTPQRTADPKMSITGFGLWVYDARNFPPQTCGNVYCNGARPHATEVAPLTLAEFDPGIELVEQPDGWFLEMKGDQALVDQSNYKPVTTELLGKATVPKLPYENADGSPLVIDRDYFGNPRDPQYPTPGPFAKPGLGGQRLKVWSQRIATLPEDSQARQPKSTKP